MGFNSRRQIEIFYNVDRGRRVTSLINTSGGATPKVYVGEEVSLKIHLVSDTNDGQTEYKLENALSSVFMLTVNAPSSSLKSGYDNPVVAYSYGHDGEYINESYIGTISTSNDFPDLEQSEDGSDIGKQYKITTSPPGETITDDAGSGHTDTGQMFNDGDLIVWLGFMWYVKEDSSSGQEVMEYLKGLNVKYDWVASRKHALINEGTPETIYSSSHNLSVGDAILPKPREGFSFPPNGGFTEDKKYWVIEVIDVDNFKIAETPENTNALSIGYDPGASGETYTEFYFWKSYANTYLGSFSVRLKTTSGQLSPSFSSATCNLVLSSLTPNDEFYKGAPQYFLSNLFEIPIDLKEPPWIEYEDYEPPDLIIPYPTTAAVLSMLSGYIAKANPTAQGFVPIYNSNGGLSPSSRTLEYLVTKLNHITEANGDTTIDVGGHNVNLSNIDTFSISSNQININTLNSGIIQGPINMDVSIVDASSGTFQKLDIIEAYIETMITNSGTITNLEASSGTITNLDVNNLKFNNDSFTISSGSIDVNKGLGFIEGEGSTDDNLDTLNGLSKGEVAILYPASSSKIILRHNVGNILCPLGVDYLLPIDRATFLINIDGTNIKLIGMNELAIAATREPSSGDGVNGDIWYEYSSGV